MEKHLFILITLIAVGLYGRSLYAQQTLTVDVKMPIVVELFTSQSCSSCPPADKILETLSENENIIILGCHVSYWDHLNWKDTLSQEFCDMRQHGYAGHRGTRRIYTPQMVVNGTKEFVGSHADKVKSALKAATALKIIDVAYEDNLINFSLPEADKGSYRVWAYGYRKGLDQDIKSGENSGLSVSYVNAAVTYSNLGAWDGMAVSKSFERPEPQTDHPLDGIALFAQKDGYGEIIAAGRLEF